MESLQLTLTMQEINIIVAALGEIPLKEGLGVFSSIQKQLQQKSEDVDR